MRPTEYRSVRCQQEPAQLCEAWDRRYSRVTKKRQLTSEGLHELKRTVAPSEVKRFISSLPSRKFPRRIGKRRGRGRSEWSISDGILPIARAV